MAKRGRPCKPTAVKKLEGNPGRRPLNENEPQPDIGIPAMPEHVEKIPAAKEFWLWAADQLVRMEVLTLADQQILALAAKEAANVLRLEEQLSEPGSETFMTVTGYEAQSPYVAMLDRARKRFRDYLNDLGLTPVSRSRLQLAPPSRPSDQLGAFAASKDAPPPKASRKKKR